MRIPRNYSSALLSGRSRTGGNYSLLQSALSKTGRGKRLSRSAQLLSGLQRKNNIFANGTQTSAGAQKLYYNMKYHAGQVCDYGNKLADQGKDSLFAKAKESGSNAEIVANIKGFVGQYNSMLENLRESGTRTDTNYLNQLNSISGLNSSELSACGVTRKSDGTLVVDEKKLEAADLETLENLFAQIGFRRIKVCDPRTHDRMIAHTSQLAHIVSSAYVKSPEAQRRRGQARATASCSTITGTAGIILTFSAEKVEGS